MHMVSILLFVISATLDNLVVGIAYGSKKLEICFLSNIVIGLISCTGTFLAMLLGKFIGHFFISTGTGNIIGSLALFCIGIWFIFAHFKEKKNININNTKNIKSSCEEILLNPETADVDKSGNIDLKESLTLGLALALNNMGIAIGASIAGLSIFLTSLFSLIFSLIAIPLGYKIGKKFLSSALKNKANLFSGLIIILLSIYEFLI